jgi:hypothetical protein
VLIHFFRTRTAIPADAVVQTLLTVAVGRVIVGNQTICTLFSGVRGRNVIAVWFKRSSGVVVFAGLIYVGSGTRGVHEK